MTKTTPDSVRKSDGYLCEYSDQPIAECYCRNVTGRTVPAIVMYCMGRYQECPVYRQRVARESGSQTGSRRNPEDARDD